MTPITVDAEELIMALESPIHIEISPKKTYTDMA